MEKILTYKTDNKTYKSWVRHFHEDTEYFHYDGSEGAITFLNVSKSDIRDM